MLLSGCSNSQASSTPASTEETTPVTTKETTTEIVETTPITTKPVEIDPSKKLIAITFDDGPNTTTTVQVLDMLEKYNVTASFFLVGNNINDDTAEVVKRAYSMGCEINNHSKSHGYMNQITPEEIKAEYKYVDDKVFEIIGEHTKFFRPPYIAVNDDMFTNISVPFIAGYGCNDWEPKVTAEARAKRTLKQAKDGAIILLHDAQGNDNTVEALDTIIPSLLEDGYQLVTVSQLFEAKKITPASKIIYSYAEQTAMYG